jgi:DeoR family ulaG and ulaABCDEF operon transcriptional repressor
MFVGAAAIGRRVFLQADGLLIRADRKLLTRAKTLIALVEGAKFRSHAGSQLCELSQVYAAVATSSIRPLKNH